MKRILHVGAALSCMVFSHRLTFRVVTVVTVVSQSFNYKPKAKRIIDTSFNFDLSKLSESFVVFI